MKRYLLVALFFLCISRAHGQGTRLTINSADTNDGHYSVGFYHSTLDIGDHLSIPLLTVCVDFTGHAAFGQSFAVTVVNLHDFAGPLRTNYLEAAWLTLQLGNGLTDVDAISNIQCAIWLITTPGTSDPYLLTSGAFAWAALAAQNYQSINDRNFVLYLKSGETGQSQLSVVPEPSVFAFFGVGLLAFVGFRRWIRSTATV